MARLSGLQREVLSLYRKCLREIRKKPVVSEPDVRPVKQQLANQLLFCDRNIEETSWPLLGTFKTAVLSPAFNTSRESVEPGSELSSPFDGIDRSEFQKNATVGKKDFTAIEYLLRKGNRQLEMYSSPGIRNIR